MITAMVRLFVAITDRDWFDALAHQAPDEVNFWQPSGRTAFRALQPGELLLFELHAPDYFKVGGGVFSHGSLAPLSLAWAAFGSKNGASSLSEMRRRIAHYRREAAPLDSRSDPVIGCCILTAFLLATGAVAAIASQLSQIDRNWQKLQHRRIEWTRDLGRRLRTPLGCAR